MPKFNLTCGLVLDLYELTMAQCYFFDSVNTQATFDLFIRESRPNRCFYVALGISEAIDKVLNFRFSKEDLRYLKTLKIFHRDFLRYLKNFRFQGDIYSLEDAEIVFPQEPILRVSASLIEAQLIESIVLNTINLYTTLATKASRVVLAAGGRAVFDFSLRRTQGLEASLACSYASYIAGCKATSNVLAGKLYNIPLVGTIAHSFIESFPNEFRSFLSFANRFPKNTVLLIDTYNTKRGLLNAIRVARILKRKGYKLLGVRIDSGDLLKEAKEARNILDKSGLKDAKIILSGNLDEYKIEEILKKQTPVDGFGVGTLMGVSADLPYSDVIYKLSEVSSEGRLFPVMKLSRDKSTLPGRKNIIRHYTKKGFFKEDVICLEEERLRGKRLLRLRVKGGEKKDKNKDSKGLRDILSLRMRRLPPYLKTLKNEKFYPVKISKRLFTLSERVKSLIPSRQRDLDDVCFLDIDTQRDFMLPEGRLFVKGAPRIIPCLKNITHLAEKKGIKIISSCDAHSPHSREFKIFPPHCIRAEVGQKKIKQTLLKSYRVIGYKKRFSPEEILNILKSTPQIIIEKDSLSIFTNPNAVMVLSGFNKVFVYGVVTEFCIREAVEGLLKNDYSIYLIEDAIKEIDSQKAERLLKDWKRRGVKIINSKDLIKILES